MNRYLFFKMLMNKEGASPGGGASGAQPSGGAPTPAPAPPPASPGAAPAPNLADDVKGVITQVFGDLRNTLFADLRKAGALKDTKTTTENPTPEPKPGASSGVTAIDVEKLLERERVFTRIATSHGLDDAQLSRMQRAARADNPEDIGVWSTSYLTDMKLVKGAPANPGTTGAAGQPPTQGAGTPNPQHPPASNKTPPQQGGALRDFETFTSPNEMTEADYDRLVNKHGVEKAEDMVAALSERWLSTLRIKRRSGSDQE